MRLLGHRDPAHHQPLPAPHTRASARAANDRLGLRLALGASSQVIAVTDAVSHQNTPLDSSSRGSFCTSDYEVKPPWAILGSNQ